MVIAKYLVDTDWAIFYLRGKEPFVTALRKYRQEGAAISVVSVAELYEGVYRGGNPSAKEASLHRFRIFPLSLPRWPAPNVFLPGRILEPPKLL